MKDPSKSASTITPEPHNCDPTKHIALQSYCIRTCGAFILIWHMEAIGAYLES